MSANLERDSTCESPSLRSTGRATLASRHSPRRDDNLARQRREPAFGLDDLRLVDRELFVGRTADLMRFFTVVGFLSHASWVTLIIDGTSMIPMELQVNIA